MVGTEKRLIYANAIEYPECFYTGEKSHDPFIEGFHQGKIDAINSIKALAPTVDAVEVVHGRWDTGRCTVCGCDWGEIALIAPVPNFCPNCGAKMDGDGNG